LVQRGQEDSGRRNNEPEAITLLNENYNSENSDTKLLELGRSVEICGLGYTYVNTRKKEDYEEGDSFFFETVLDARSTFVIYSSRHIDRRKMAGVTYRRDSETGNTYFTVFTKTRRFEIENLLAIKNGESVETIKEQWNEVRQRRSGEVNPLNKIPITEYFRAYDRTGCFEHVLSELKNLNLLLSDYANSVEQNTQAIWHTNDIEFEKQIVVDEDGNEHEVDRKLKTGDMVQTYTTKDGRTPTIETLAINYDYSGMLDHINATRARILEECHVPERNNNSGGSTGVGMDSANGQKAAEEDADKEHKIVRGCKMEEAEIALAAVKISNVIEPDNPMLTLTKKDLSVHVSCQKNDELTTKINFFATAVSHGIYGLHALEAMDSWDDVNQVWQDSKATIEAYQNSIFNKDNEAVGGDGESQPNAGRLSPDISDQSNNSPLLNG
jgi:SPP1 family phage portal protein